MNADRKRPTHLVLILKTCVVLYVLLSGCNSPEPAGAPLPVRVPGLEVVYFVPSDQHADPDHTVRIDTMVTGAKKFFDHWMKYWGHTRRMQLPDTISAGRINISTIHGKHKLAYYIKQGADAIESETEQWYSTRGTNGFSRTILIFTCVNGTDIAGVPFCARGSTAFVIDAPSAVEKNVRVDAGHGKKTYDLTTGTYHELGHALGLPHNWGNGSDNDRFGHALMGSGDGHPISRCYLTIADCALLNNSPVFKADATGPLPPSRLELLGITGSDNGSGATVTGKFSIHNDSVVSVLFYNDCFIDGYGDNRDYDATSWAGTTFGNDSFAVQMPYKDFRYNYDTTYQLRIGFCTRQGDTKWMNFRYAMQSGIFHGTITKAGEPRQISSIVSISGFVAALLLFVYYKKKV